MEKDEIVRKAIQIWADGYGALVEEVDNGYAITAYDKVENWDFYLRIGFDGKLIYWSADLDNYSMTVGEIIKDWHDHLDKARASQNTSKQSHVHAAVKKWARDNKARAHYRGMYYVRFPPKIACLSECIVEIDANGAIASITANSIRQIDRGIIRASWKECLEKTSANLNDSGYKQSSTYMDDLDFMVALEHIVTSSAIQQVKINNRSFTPNEIIAHASSTLSDNQSLKDILADKYQEERDRITDEAANKIVIETQLAAIDDVKSDIDDGTINEDTSRDYIEDWLKDLQNLAKSENKIIVRLAKEQHARLFKIYQASAIKCYSID